jgi:biopolymer transport protein ExbD
MVDYPGPDVGYSGGSEPSDVAGARGVAAAGDIRRVAHGSTISRAKAAREARRAQQFAKFRLTELNLVPLVDTFVSIVFFALTTATVGELAPVVKGVNLPESRTGGPALQQITLGIGPQVTLAGRPVMTTRDAAAATSNVPGQPLVIPPLYAALRTMADSVRGAHDTPATQQVEAPLAIQGDRTMRYDLLSRVIMTARVAGFKTISLQVNRAGTSAGPAVPAPAPASPTAGVSAPARGPGPLAKAG